MKPLDQYALTHRGVDDTGTLPPPISAEMPATVPDLFELEGFRAYNDSWNVQGRVI